MVEPGNQSQPIPTLLIVEDGDEYLEFFERHLRGYRLLQAHDATETLAALKRIWYLPAIVHLENSCRSFRSWPEHLRVPDAPLFYMMTRLFLTVCRTKPEQGRS